MRVTDLPDDVIYTIGNFIRSQDIQQMHLTCKTFHKNIKYQKKNVLDEHDFRFNHPLNFNSLTMLNYNLCDFPSLGYEFIYIDDTSFFEKIKKTNGQPYFSIAFGEQLCDKINDKDIDEIRNCFYEMHLYSNINLFDLHFPNCTKINFGQNCDAQFITKTLNCNNIEYASVDMINVKLWNKECDVFHELINKIKWLDIMYCDTKKAYNIVLIPENNSKIKTIRCFEINCDLTLGNDNNKVDNVIITGRINTWNKNIINISAKNVYVINANITGFGYGFDNCSIKGNLLVISMHRGLDVLNDNNSEMDDCPNGHKIATLLCNSNVKKIIICGLYFCNRFVFKNFIKDIPNKQIDFYCWNENCIGHVPIFCEEYEQKNILFKFYKHDANFDKKYAHFM